MDHPVSFSDARRFWLTTSAMAYIPLLLTTGLLWWAGESNKGWSNNWLHQLFFTQVYTPVWPVISIHLGWICFFLTATGCPSYFCHPKRLEREKQNRAISLSYYACAPLAFMPFLIILIVIAAGLDHLVSPALASQLRMFIAGAASLLALVMIALWYFHTIHIVGMTTCRTLRGQLFVAGAIFLIWLLLAGFCLIVLPLMIHYLWMLIYSFF
jgi:hypothetical protein